MTVIAAPEGARLPRPTFGATRAPDLWVDEAIWGHRLYDEQVPWLALLECLSVVYALRREGRAFAPETSERLSYLPLAQLRLRNILFNNPRLEVIAAQPGDDATKWRAWTEEMARSSGGLAETERDYGYLAACFSSFRDFVQAVEFLRRCAVESANNRRWNSKFLFPFGPGAVFEDVEVKGTSYGLDRRFFARSGELLYLMLARSGRGPALARLVEARLVRPDHPVARLANLLQGESQQCNGRKEHAYLPFAARPEYEALGRDWEALLSRPLPGFDVVPHLVTMSGLNVLRYLLNRAAEEVGEAERPSMVLEIVGPRRSAVRSASADSYLANNQLPERAVRAYVDAVQEVPVWPRGGTGPEAGATAAEELTKRFHLGQDIFDETSNEIPDALLDEVREAAVTRHRTHVAKVHSTWSRAIGLSSKRLSQRLRYAPTDSLLRTLVICCVEEEMEFREFVAHLYDRYGFVIGDVEAAQVPLTAHLDREDFVDNQRRLEDRLASLGLVRRLSDQCAYVVNPLRDRGAA